MMAKKSKDAQEGTGKKGLTTEEALGLKPGQTYKTWVIHSSSWRFTETVIGWAWVDLRPDLFRYHFIIDTRRGDSPELRQSYSKALTEGMNRLRLLSPYIEAAESVEFDEDEWRNIAREIGFPELATRPIDLDFAIKIGFKFKTLWDHSRENQPQADSPPRAIVILDPPQITIDGTAYAVKDDQATYLSELIACGDWLSDQEFKKQAPELRKTARPDRLRKGLPLEVKQCIETHDSRGSRWKKP